MLVEMVWRMMRWQPHYKPLKKWEHVLYSATPNAASRKKAVVAIARMSDGSVWVHRQAVVVTLAACIEGDS